jgi:chromosomal replication initiation ATPase DnaA
MDYHQKINRIKELIERNESEYLTYISIRAIVLNAPETDKIARYSLEDIARQINELTGLTIEELNQNTRKADIRQFRQMAHYKASKFTYRPLNEIGRYFGGRKHSTVLNSKYKIQNMLDTDKQFREQYETFLNN